MKKPTNIPLRAGLIITLMMLALLTAPLLAKEQRALETDSLVPGEGQDRTKRSERIIEFAGRQWTVKSGDELGPGPNCWSDSEESVWVDESGQLHLKMREIDGTWCSAEVYTTACTRYGMHRFFVTGPLDNLDKNVVAALLLYRDDETEVDIEFAKWGQENPTYNAQYVVQPWDTLGNLEPFSMTSGISDTTHYIDWGASSIHFKSIRGHYREPPDELHRIHEWEYLGSDIPAHEQSLRIHINLWLHQSDAPSDGQDTEIIVKSAQFPQSVYLPLVLRLYPPAWITVTVDGAQAMGEVWPPLFCNTNYKVALYAYIENDIWYVQPYDDSRRDIPIDPVDCTWESDIHRWDQLAAFLVPASYHHPPEILTGPCPPSPLDVDYESIWAASCYPAAFPQLCGSSTKAGPLRPRDSLPRGR
jgi:hypothetical protein